MHDLKLPLAPAIAVAVSTSQQQARPPMADVGDATVTTGAPKQWVWVPIRSLGPRHRGKIALHLLSLEASDRYLRFGYSATDAQIAKYVDILDFERDEVFGIFNRRLELVAVAHLAHQPGASAAQGSEFGVSVHAKARARGFGHRLFEHAMLHARNRGVKRLFIHALSENNAMLKIARNLGAKVERHGAEAKAWLELPPDNIASRVGEIVEQRAAEIDYQFKLHARQFDTDSTAEACGLAAPDSRFDSS